jgi:2,5-diketo-D-gluconate reductase A
MTTSDYAQPAAKLAGGSMPLLGFGTWQIEDSEATGATEFALEAGYRHIDTATGYENEAGIGRALASATVPRDELFLTTKLPPDHGGRERQTLEASLSKLGVDRVDLWLVHWPPNGKASPEVWEQVVQAQNDGLATSIGVSNYSLSQIDELISATGVAPAVNQIKWGPVLEGYSPFKVSNLDDPTLTSIAEAHDATTAQVIVAWHLAHGFVVIPKSVKRERIVANAAGALVELDDAEVASIDGLSTVA